jgi:hypothetical protein
MNGIKHFGFGSVVWSASMISSLLPNKRLVRTLPRDCFLKPLWPVPHIRNVGHQDE